MVHGKVILVSGGTRGLGLALTRALLADGWTVSTFSRSISPEIQELQHSSPRLRYSPGDLSEGGGLEKIVTATERELGPIYGLVNNAALAVDGLLALTPVRSIQSVVEVNLTGTLLLTRLVVRRMLPRSEGRIISISSIVGQRGYTGLAAYAATKAGLNGMTRALARELGARNILVNAVAPGYLDTDMAGKLSREQRNQIIRRTPLGRLGQVEDVTGIVRFLLSEVASFITGQVIAVDGGLTC